MKAGKDYIGVGCGGLVINDDNQVLLVKRAMDSRTEPGTWSRPGGAVEFGESYEEAVARETLEETGVVVEIVKMLTTHQIIDKEKGTHWIGRGYLAKYVSGVAVNVEPNKHDDVKWFSFDELPDNINEYTMDSIKVYLESNK